MYDSLVMEKGESGCDACFAGVVVELPGCGKWRTVPEFAVEDDDGFMVEVLEDIFFNCEYGLFWFAVLFDQRVE